MLRVTEYFAKALKFIRNNTLSRALNQARGWTEEFRGPESGHPSRGQRHP